MRENRRDIEVLNSIIKAVEPKIGSFDEVIHSPLMGANRNLEISIPGSPRYETTILRGKPQWTKLVGILFCLPETRMGKDEILPAIDYFHYRTSRFLDLFCVGYRLSPATQDTSASPIVTVGGQGWSFNAQDFELGRRELQEHTSWKFSGQTDLVLAVARRPPNSDAHFDFTQSVCCNLEQLVKDAAIPSARSLLEQISQFGEKYTGEDPVWELSDALGARKAKDFLKTAVLSLLPATAAEFYKSTEAFAIKEIGPTVR
jgi:hypothetical protein